MSTGLCAPRVYPVRSSVIRRVLAFGLLGKKNVESTLCAELWNEENEHAEQREAWEEERSVDCALCHPLIIRKRIGTLPGGE